MQLPQSDQDAIEVLPLPAGFFCGSLNEVGAEAGKSVRCVNRDFSEILMCVCDSLECHRDPFDIQRYRTKDHISEFCRF